jgi:hypothetical protein
MFEGAAIASALEERQLACLGRQPRSGDGQRDICRQQQFSSGTMIIVYCYTNPRPNPLTHKAHSAPTHTSALFTFGLAHNTRACTFTRSIGFCAIWVCISSSSSSRTRTTPVLVMKRFLVVKFLSRRGLSLLITSHQIESLRCVPYSTPFMHHIKPHPLKGLGYCVIQTRELTPCGRGCAKIQRISFDC